MNFWDKIAGRYSPEAEHAQRMKIAQDGDKLMSVVESGAFQVIVDLILDPMEQEAFNAFVRIEPTNSMEVLQTQKMVQISREIKRRVEAKIESAKLAREQMRRDSNPEEG